MNPNHNDKVRFHIVRKRAFAGSLLTYKLFINGEYVGSLRNGKTLDVDVARSDLYFIDNEIWNFERNGIIHSSDLDNPSQVFVEIRRAGGWKTESYNEFYVQKNGVYVNLPSFDYSRYFDACYDDGLFSKLTEQEKIFTRCLGFQNAIADAADEVLCDERLFEMLDAIQLIGAEQYTSAFTCVIERLFHGIPLPLSDNSLDDKDILERTEKVNRLVWDSEKKNGAAEELHKCIVKFIIDDFLRNSEPR